MIGYINGIVHTVTQQQILLMVGSYGFDIFVPTPASFVPLQEVSLYTHLHWQQEHGPSLYGFNEMADKEVFLLALDCSGIGPKGALTILRTLGATHFLQAIAQEDAKLLSKTPGIGQKKAEQIILHLKDKVATLIASGRLSLGDTSGIDWATITQALEALNYSSTEIIRTVKHLKGAPLENATFDFVLRQALSFLSKQS